jgi:hypothetical protein
MKINRFGILVSMVSLLLYFPAISYAQQQAGDFEAVITGSGASGSGFDTNNFVLEGQFGHFYSRDLEIGLRQAIRFSDPGDTSALSGSTRAFADWHFDMDKWQPFVGASMGGQYGSGTTGGFIIGPEAGVKYFVQERTFLLGQASYLFDVQEDVGDGAFFYNVGFGILF